MVDLGVAGNKQNLEGNENDGNMKCSALDISTGASPNKCSGHLEFDSKGNSSDDNKIEKTAETNSTSGNLNVGLDAELSPSPGTGNATCGSSNVRVPVLGIMDHEIEESGEGQTKILKDCSSTPPKGMISVTGCLASDVSPMMEEHFPMEVDRYAQNSGSSSLSAPRPSGIGLHLNSIGNAPVMNHGGIVQSDENECMSSKGAKVQSLLSIIPC
ncbi:hypothetical protein QJS10_CPA10g00413 [Acorus calamus]|uniref:Uncharacterized protein n=1 Tax=Acorus calamus TaxID=4465 RepID=A0AAV9DXD2_ACOCL|nr:hypothetical protein QJS10_CPA10g00413 [Acorus calamus]